MLGASIVGVVGAGVAATVLTIGAQAGTESVATSDPYLTAAVPTAPAETESADTASGETGRPITTADSVSPDTVPRPAVDDTAPPNTDPADTQPALPSIETTVAPIAMFAFADPATCPVTGRAAVVDRENQRAWLCGDGLVTHGMPITSAWIQPDPGDYEIYAKDMNSSSRFTGRYSTMTHFVAFTHGKIRGARIAFHSVPTYSDGSYVQTLESVGTPELRGDSAGCIRVLPTDAEVIWSWLEVGDVVRVVS